MVNIPRVCAELAICLIFIRQTDRHIDRHKDRHKDRQRYRDTETEREKTRI